MKIEICSVCYNFLGICDSSVIELKSNSLKIKKLEKIGNLNFHEKAEFWAEDDFQLVFRSMKCAICNEKVGIEILSTNETTEFLRKSRIWLCSPHSISIETNSFNFTQSGIQAELKDLDSKFSSASTFLPQITKLQEEINLLFSNLS